jgi:hypothetical protein
MALWSVRATRDDANRELMVFLENEDWRKEIRRILKLLSEQPDPRSFNEEIGLIVDEIMYDSPNWYRVKVPRYGMRIIFRLLVVTGNPLQPFELESSQPVPTGMDEYFIDLIQIAFRKDSYGAELRRRYLNSKLPPYSE